MAVKLPINNAFEAFLQTPKLDKQFRLSINRNTLLAFIVSLLIHALILFFVVPKLKQAPVPEPAPFEVVLAQPELKPQVIPQPPAAPEKKLIEKPPENPKEKPVKKPVKKTRVMTKPADKKLKPTDFTVPNVLASPKPQPEPLPRKPSKPDDAPTDMMAYVNKQRAKRNAEEADAAKINAEAVAKEKGPSEEEKRDAKIKSNFQNGTNGIFEITSLSSNSATFSFLGWTSSLSNSRREFFEVDAARGQDVRLVMIRRMITLIRVHYQGDFDWQSQRLSRTIIKSARPEDSAELEDFLMQEFFGRNYKTQ